jgi:hypothetical protein
MSRDDMPANNRLSGPARRQPLSLDVRRTGGCVEKIGESGRARGAGLILAPVGFDEEGPRVVDTRERWSLNLR